MRPLIRFLRGFIVKNLCGSWWVDADRLRPFSPQMRFSAAPVVTWPPPSASTGVDGCLSANVAALAVLAALASPRPLK